MSPAWITPRTAYLHVPFCGHHCGYCDFAVTAGQDDLIPAYLEALAVELARLGTPFPVESVFIGGGTPTYLPLAELRNLLVAVNRWLPTPPGAEFTIESTPESVDRDKAKLMADHGVTRLSIGVQSFHPHLLATLDRRHGVEHIGRAVAAAMPVIPDLSLDLIYAAPGQTMQEWRADLQRAIELGTAHLSCYGLTYEKGTPLWKALKNGLVPAIGEELELEFYRAARAELASAGFQHYEVSNFARAGKQSQHNHRYWANEAYHGFGVGAARYLDGERALNRRDTRGYIRAIFAGEDPTLNRETLGARERAFETLATQLRRREGISFDQFREQSGWKLVDLVGARLPQLVELELVELTAASLSLTDRGLEVADAVVSDLLKAQ